MSETPLKWIKSRRCESASCVEVAVNEWGSVMVRNSDNIYEAPLFFSKEEWTEFVGGVRDGDFDFQ